MRRAPTLDDVSELRAPRGALYAGAWIFLFCAITQVPYALVWAGKSTFLYDAFTIFSPWNIAQLDVLRSGSGLFSVFQDNIPTDIWPSYFFYGALRQFAALFQPNTATAHAVVQAIHITLLVPAVALLFRSMGIPVRFGALGGLVFTLSGIHVSLTQHVFSSEALLYLVLSLWGLRNLLLNWRSRQRTENVLWFALTGIVLVSLVRVHHEAILYVIPISLWTACHLWIVGRVSGAATVGRSVLMLTALAIFIAVCSVPMLLTAYEMSLVNKTLIASYDQLGPYFRDIHAFLFALTLPHFSGTSGTQSVGAFSFGQDSTLGYLFAGTLTVPLLLTVAVAWMQQRRWRETALLLTTAGLLLGFTMGAGNPVHRLLCTVFPFLVQIGHNHYGLHLLYLLGAFAVAEGARLLSSGRYWRQFVVIALLTGAVATVLVPRTKAPTGWGFSGDANAFAIAVGGDLIWMWIVTATAIGLAAMYFSVCPPNSSDKVRAAAGTAVFALMSALISTDHIRPLRDAHFVPNHSWVNWLADPIGGFNPSRPIVEFFKEQTGASARALRVLPVFPHGGGWQPNSLLPLNVHLLNMAGDSGGNRFISAMLANAPDADRIRALIADYGVEYFWVARWLMDEWSAALGTSDAVELVFSAEYGGDVYRTKAEYLQTASIVGNTIHLPWRGEDDTVYRGQALNTWHFALPKDRPERAMSLQLPLMWHAAYAVSLPDGTDVSYTQDDKGRVLVEHLDSPADLLVVNYPRRWLSISLVFSGLLYVVMVGVAVAFGALHLRRRRRPEG